jgi:hypothetical protein
MKAWKKSFPYVHWTLATTKSQLLLVEEKDFKGNLLVFSLARKVRELFVTVGTTFSTTIS